MAMLEELALKRRTFNDDDRLKRDHAEGAIIHSIPAAVFIVRDHFISTVCSGCLKTPIQHSQRTNPLQQCSRCKYLRYCSADCQVRNQFVLNVRVKLILTTLPTCGLHFRLATGKNVTRPNAECWRPSGKLVRTKIPVLLASLLELAWKIKYVFVQWISLFWMMVSCTVRYKK